MVIDMIEDLPTTEINAEEEIMPIEPSTAGCGAEASGKQVQIVDSGNCAIQISAAMEKHAREKDDELLGGD